MNLKVRDILPYFLIGLLFYFHIKKPFESTKNQSVKVDSVKIKSSTKLKTGSFKMIEPKPIVVVLKNDKNKSEDRYINTLIKKLELIDNENEKRDKLLEELTLKVYEKKYEDSTVTITVRDSINGRLNSQNVSWKVKPQSYSYFEKTVTKKLKPRFSLSGGIGVSSGILNNSNPEINLILGFKSKNGYEILSGYSTEKRLSFILKKDLFTKY